MSSNGRKRGRSRVPGRRRLRRRLLRLPREHPVLQQRFLRGRSAALVSVSREDRRGQDHADEPADPVLRPTAGRILLDGVDLRDYRIADLRNQFAIVLQEPVLFSTSIAENIAYARPDASEEEISRPPRRPTPTSSSPPTPGLREPGRRAGMRLSGGERQRISLARAFLKDAPILILDEPTSSVDTKTEAAIMEAMERLMRGRTTFMIAHR